MQEGTVPVQRMGRWYNEAGLTGRSHTMPIIRIPQEHWAKVWGALVASGPISRVTQEPIYNVSEEQVRLLRKKKLPFDLLATSNGPVLGEKNAPDRSKI
jgi:hypothetical protein